MTSHPKLIYCFSGTHWDREWHRALEGFRCRLVDMIDRAVECVEHVPGYGSFFLDGQSIILNDYLEVRPHRREIIDRLLKEEKLFAGPFYVLQDEMVEDGELFVRNLQKGIALAREHGCRRFVGYSTDSFGHAAQLPQLLRLAGVDSMVFSRAFVGQQQDNLWQAPDGSEVYFAWLPLGNGGGSHQDCLDGGRHFPEDREQALAAFERFWAKLSPYIHRDAALIADAADQIWPDPAGLKLAEDFNAKHPDGPQIVFTSLPDAIEKMSRSISNGGGEPARVRGEIRMNGKTVDGWLLPGTYSTRMTLKIGVSTLTRRLLALEKLLTLHPYCDKSHGAVERAWDALLENIPHDSICGCHVDAVYIDNLSRLNVARGIIDYVTEKTLRAFCPPQATTGKTPAAVFYDSSPGERVYKPFNIECSYPCIEDPKRVTLAAKDVDFVISAVERYPTHNGHLKTYRIEGFYRNTSNAHVFDASLKEGQPRPAPAELNDPLPLLTFTDSGDAGDSYNYSPPARDEMISSTGTPQRISTRRLNEHLTQTQADVVLNVPAGLAADRKSRSSEKAALHISYTQTRDSSSGLTWIRGTLHNAARDHRLRLVIPTASPESHSISGAPFHFERRPVALDLPAEDYSERPLTDYPFVDYIRYGGTSVYAQTNGEYQITQRGIEITLCRCIGWLGRPDLAYRKGQAGPNYEIPAAQLLHADIPFSFIVARSLDDVSADYARKTLLFETSALCAMVDDPPNTRAALPLAVDGAELTALRWLDEGKIELRLFNPRSCSANVRIRPIRPWTSLHVTDLNHRRRENQTSAANGGPAELSLRPFEIVTLVADV